MLAAHPTAMPHLTALRLAMRAELDGCTGCRTGKQQTDLNLFAWSTPSIASQVPVRRSCPNWRSCDLDITMTVAGDGVRAGTPPGLANLAAMRKLTRLVVDLRNSIQS